MIKKVLGLVSLLVIFSSENAIAMIDLNRYSEKLYVPIVKIEDQVITEHDLQQKIAIMRISGNNINRHEATEALIDQELLLYHYKDRKISQDALDITIEKLAKENKLTKNSLEKTLVKFGIEKKYLEKHVAAQLILNDMMISKVKGAAEKQRHLFQTVTFVKEEIKKGDAVLLQPITQYNFTDKSIIKLSEIIVKRGENLESIIDMLRRNESFTRIKNAFPNDVELTAKDGSLGWLNFNEISDLYKEAIKNIIVNQIGEPLQSNDKLLFIKLIDVKNISKTKKYINPEYLNLSFREKSNYLFNKFYGNLISHNTISQLKRKLYIELL